MIWDFSSRIHRLPFLKAGNLSLEMRLPGSTGAHHLLLLLIMSSDFLYFCLLVACFLFFLCSACSSFLYLNFFLHCFVLKPFLYLFITIVCIPLCLHDPVSQGLFHTKYYHQCLGDTFYKTWGKYDGKYY